MLNCIKAILCYRTLKKLNSLGLVKKKYKFKEILNAMKQLEER